MVSKMKDKVKKEHDKLYNDYVKRVTPTHNCWLNMGKAFISGGLICVIGQAFNDFYTFCGFTKEIASGYTTLTLVLISVVLTCLNLVNPITKFAGAGYLVPITGFANSVAACALEFKSEGEVFGIGCKIFTIAGPVILYGIVTTWILGFLYWLVQFIF
jgi:stage V sporulation protein AC